MTDPWYPSIEKYLIKRRSGVHFFWQTSTFRRVVNKILNVSPHSFKWFFFHLNRVKFCEFDYFVKSWYEFIRVAMLVSIAHQVIRLRSIAFRWRHSNWTDLSMHKLHFKLWVWKQKIKTLCSIKNEIG